MIESFDGKYCGACHKSVAFPLSDCHPDIVQMKRGTTRSLSMNSILEGESCGLCHTRVAVPLDDCKKCHPKMKGP